MSLRLLSVLMLSVWVLSVPLLSVWVLSVSLRSVSLLSVSLLSVSLLSVSLLSVPLLSVWARAADEESCCSENQFPVSLASQLFNCTLERRPVDATGTTIYFPT